MTIDIRREIAAQVAWEIGRQLAYRTKKKITRRLYTVAVFLTLGLWIAVNPSPAAHTPPEPYQLSDDLIASMSNLEDMIDDLKFRLYHLELQNDERDNTRSK